MEFGIFHEFQCAQEVKRKSRRFHESFAQVEAATLVGLDACVAGGNLISPGRLAWRLPMTAASAIARTHPAPEDRHRCAVCCRLLSSAAHYRRSCHRRPDQPGAIDFWCGA